MPLQALSLGREVDIWRPQSGVVHSAFDRAVNLLIEGEMWTVTTAPREDAPFGIRLDPGARPGGFHVRAAARVHVRAGFVAVGSMVLDCRMASRWFPARWESPVAGLEARISAVEGMARPRAWPESAGMASHVTGALSASDRQLAAAVRRTVGRGPGLTPAGDDVVVGILVVLTSGVIGARGVEGAFRLVRALVPVLPSTSDISRHLLDQAARGLPGRALHELGKTLIEGAAGNVLENVVERVLATGSTSGADACLGLTAACRHFFITPQSATP